jgi:glycosyltransferase involved in cell wall biosynthesis
MSEQLAISVILPVMNEIEALRTTVETINDVAAEHIHEILIVVSDRTKPESLQVARQLQAEVPIPIHMHLQQLPRLGGALQEAFGKASGSHVLLMASDLETDPRLIPLFVEKSLQARWDIVATSRWLNGGGFDGYGHINRALNYVFQKACRIAFPVPLTDLTFGYRLYRREVLQNIVWEELGHPFLLECLLKPLRLGATVTEVPCAWQARREGESANSFLQKLSYLTTAVKIRFMKRNRITLSPTVDCPSEKQRPAVERQ